MNLIFLGAAHEVTGRDVYKRQNVVRLRQNTDVARKRPFGFYALKAENHNTPFVRLHNVHVQDVYKRQAF